MTWRDFLDQLGKIFGGTVEKPSPGDYVPDSSLVFDVGKITLDTTRLNIPFTLPPKVWLTSVQGTNSMEPVIDIGNVAILIDGADETNHKLMCDAIIVGDIVVWQKPDGKATIHRVVNKDHNDVGRYFRTRGDNNYAADPDVLRDSDIKWLLIGIVY
jgi:signal peptidase I